jgi:hypothetical protein
MPRMSAAPLSEGSRPSAGWIESYLPVVPVVRGATALPICSALGGTRTPNLLIRSRRQRVFHMLQRCHFARQSLGGTQRTVDGSRCYINCYTDGSHNLTA